MEMDFNKRDNYLINSGDTLDLYLYLTTAVNIKIQILTQRDSICM